MKEVKFLHFDVYDTSAFGYKRPAAIIDDLGIEYSWVECSMVGNYFKFFEPINLPKELPEQMTLGTIQMDDDEYKRRSS